MLPFLSKQISYNFAFKKQVLVGVLLGGIVLFIMVFLQPFDTYSFKSDHKYLIFSGFGLILTITYCLCGRFENLWYLRRKRRWEVRYEIFSFLGFLFVSSLPIHFYNQVFLNHLFDRGFNGYKYFKHGLWFFKNSIVPVMFILIPFYVYFRNKLGVLITPKSLDEIELSGINKGEKLRIEKGRLLFVKASENYIQIYYSKNNAIEHRTFRNTLAAIKKQAPFLYKCHRSYLVNIPTIKTITGNSQNAKIAFQHNKIEIPLSKSYYKTVKSTLGVEPKN